MGDRGRHHSSDSSGADSVAPLSVHYRICGDRRPNTPCICQSLTFSGPGHPGARPTLSEMPDSQGPQERAQRASLDGGIA